MRAAPRLTKSAFFEDRTLPLELIRRNPQEPYPLHTHEFSELVIVFSGRGIHFTESEEWKIGRGDVFVIQGECAHGYRSLDSLSLVNILFDAGHLGLPQSDLLAIPGYHALLTVEPHYRREHRFASRLRLADPQLAHLSLLLDGLERETSAREPGYRSMAAAYFMQILGYLSRCFASTATPKHQSLLRLGEAIGHLEQNVGRRVALSELLAITHMSESSLLRAFRKTVGLSPIGYHIRLKVQRACRLLVSSDLPVTEIAFRSGFSDSNYFSREFRKVMGMSPRTFRRSDARPSPANGVDRSVEDR